MERGPATCGWGNSKEREPIGSYGLRQKYSNLRVQRRISGPGITSVCSIAPYTDKPDRRSRRASCGSIGSVANGLHFAPPARRCWLLR
jgi:hypothetical protein